MCVCDGSQSELHYSGLCFCFAKKRDFHFSPWLPQKWTYQICYLAYRWSIMVYFLFWLAVTISHAIESIQFKYLIFLTHWGFIVWNAYLVISTASVTIAFYQDKVGSAPSSVKIDQEEHGWNEGIELECCGREMNSIFVAATGDGCDSSREGESDDFLGSSKWNDTSEGRDSDHKDAAFQSKTNSGGCCKSTTISPPVRTLHKVQWLLFVIGGEYAVVITALYWVLFTGNHDCSGHEHNLFSIDSLHLHMFNGVFAVVELWATGIPVRLYHAIYSIAFGCAYILFTAVYYAAGGKDAEGNRFIYPFLDYESCPMAAVCLAVSCAVFLVGAVHFIFFLQYIVRRHITNWMQQFFCEEGKGSSDSCNLV